MESINVYCVNTQQSYSVPLGSTFNELATIILGEDSAMKPVAALLDNNLQSLRYRLFRDGMVEFVDGSTQDGYSVVVRSLIFLLYTAFRELYPTGSMNTEFYISNGVYCSFEADGYIDSEEQIAQICDKMRQIVAENCSITRELTLTEKACELFVANGLHDKANLLIARGTLYSSVYKLKDSCDYYFGVLAHKTSALSVFDLKKYGEGVLLVLPDAKDPSRLAEPISQPKLLQTFEENRRWNKILGVTNIGDLNQSIAAGEGNALLNVCEAMQEKKISQIADMIASRRDKVKVVLIAGPSSSGKTTFCKRLSIQLMLNGLHPIPLSMDDYFVEREFTPRDENGKYDFENVDAVDIPYFTDSVKRILAGEEVEIPKFSFIEGRKIFEGRKVKFGKNSILIIEGIHGLNPKVTSLLDSETIFKVFISALTAISIDEHNPINPTDNRLIRRMVRDHKYRGRSAQATLEGWEDVLAGEKKYIIPYQEEADVMFNTAMIYELAVLKSQAEPLLREVPETSPVHSKALKLLKFLSYVKILEPISVPHVSLLREFLGGSTFKYD
ncbi:MAG: nucleoside kinase [Marinifilaceae bacterium]|nr:nucleoside kinase [Marinifilaceae bacterium]